MRQSWAVAGLLICIIMIKQAPFQIFLWTFNFKYIDKFMPRAKYLTKLLSFLQKLASFCLNNSRYAGWNFVPAERLKPAKAMPIHADSYLYLSCQKQVLRVLSHKTGLTTIASCLTINWNLPNCVCKLSDQKLSGKDDDDHSNVAQFILLRSCASTFDFYPTCCIIILCEFYCKNAPY